jgi:hypothetical protein
LRESVFARRMETLLKFTAWPIAAIIIVCALALIFRTPITTPRGVKVGQSAIDLTGDAPRAAIAQQKEENPTVKTELPTVPASHAMPPRNELYIALESELRKTVEDLKMPPELERAWLIRTIAVARVDRAHEISYRTILGSQIALMLLANTAAPPDMERARAMYEEAKAAHPSIYENFAFETWVHYPLNVGLLRLDNSSGAALIRITHAGQDFLRYLVDNGLTSAKIG